MSIEQVKLPEISPAIVPDSLAWEDFAKDFLGSIDPSFHGNIEFAFRIAQEAHGSQPPRDTGEPFFCHPLMVARYQVEAGCTHPSHIQAAFLHDVPEDNLDFILKAEARIIRGVLRRKVSDSDVWMYYETDLLRRQFCYDTAEIVEAVTKPESKAKTFRAKQREERDYQRQLREGPPGARIVKAADRLHNVRTLPRSDKPRIARKITETRTGYLPIFEIGAVEYPREGGALLRQIKIELAKLDSSSR